MLSYPPPLTQHVHIQTDGDYTQRVVTPFGTTRLKILHGQRRKPRTVLRLGRRGSRAVRQVQTASGEYTQVAQPDTTILVPVADGGILVPDMPLRSSWPCVSQITCSPPYVKLVRHFETDLFWFVKVGEAF